MNFEIKNLTLYEDLVFSADEKAPVEKTEELSIYTNAVSGKDLNPDREKFLTQGKWCGYGLEPGKKLAEGQSPDGIIPAGKYLFVQFFLDTDDEVVKKEMLEKAAEAVFLEASWQELSLSDTVYVRAIAEGDKKAWQLFREK